MNGDDKESQFTNGLVENVKNKVLITYLEAVASDSVARLSPLSSSVTQICPRNGQGTTLP
jgi:hypothetical protein